MYHHKYLHKPKLKIFNYANFIEIMLGNDVQAQHKALEFVFLNKLSQSETTILAQAIAEKTKSINETDTQYPAILFLHGLIHYLCGTYHKAIAHFQESAKKGYLHAYIELGLMYQLGEGTEQNFVTAVGHMEKGLSISVQKPLQIPAQVKLWILANLYSEYFQNDGDIFGEEALQAMRFCYDHDANDSLSKLLQNNLMKNLHFSLDYLDSIDTPALAPYVEKVKTNILAYVKREIINTHLGTDQQSEKEKKKNLCSSVDDFSPMQFKYFLLLIKRYAEKADIPDQERQALIKLISLENWSRDALAAKALRHLAIVDPVAQYWLGKCYMNLLRENATLDNAGNRTLARRCFQQASVLSELVNVAQSALLTLDLMEDDKDATPLSTIKGEQYTPRLFPKAMKSEEVSRAIRQHYPELIHNNENPVTKFYRHTMVSS